MVSKPAGQELRSNVAWSCAGTADAMLSGDWLRCAAPRSLCRACAETSGGRLKCETQPSPSRMSATAQWHQQLDHCTPRALIWLGGDFLKQHPLKSLLQGG